MKSENTTIYQSSSIQKKSKRCSLLGLGIHTWEAKNTWYPPRTQRLEEFFASLHALTSSALQKF